MCVLVEGDDDGGVCLTDAVASSPSDFVAVDAEDAGCGDGDFLNVGGDVGECEESLFGFEGVEEYCVVGFENVCGVEGGEVPEACCVGGCVGGHWGNDFHCGVLCGVFCFAFIIAVLWGGKIKTYVFWVVTWGFVVFWAFLGIVC